VTSLRKPFVSVHRRILLVFLISIALPGAYLGYLGLRSILQEQELQQGLLVQNVGRALQFEIDRIEQRLEESEEKIARDLVVSTALHKPSGGIIGTTQPAWIERALIFDSRLSLRRPLPFSTESPPTNKAATEEPSLQNKIESATRLEIQGNQAAALAAYRLLLPEAQSLRSKVVLNTYIARSAAATGNHDVGRRAYEAIVRADSTFLVSHPIPYAAFAWLEIADNLLKQGNVSKALEESLQFYQRLLDFYYRFSSEQYSYLSHRLHAQVDTCAKALNANNGIRATMRRLEEEERLLTTTLSQAEAIGAWLHAQRRVLSAQDYVGTVSHHSLPIGDRSLSLSLILVDKPSGPRDWAVLVLRPEEVQREFILPALQSGDLADGFNISIRPDSSLGASPAQLASSPMHKTAPLLPAAVVSVSGRRTSAIRVFGVQISLLSLGFGIFVVGIVLLGIFIIYRDIRREEELSKMKSDFISNVSHELKTPIAAIRMLADNLRQSRVEEEPRKMEYYQLISKESARLSHLIDNILDFSRVEGQRKRFQFEPCDVSAVVNETVRQFRSLMDDQSQKIETTHHENLPEVIADPDAIALALFNLLDNAAKYSAKGSRIDVGVSSDGGFVCIDVSDHGVGIPREEQAKIFEKFYRVQRTDGRKIPGSGIGLTLVREIAEAHKGQVELVSEPGAGSTFRIKLPIGG
jgi:signal transduction histidine kinase